MVILVRCPDQSVTVALASKLEELIDNGLISEFLGATGWIAVSSLKPCPKLPVTPRSRCCSRQLSCL